MPTPAPSTPTRCGCWRLATYETLQKRRGDALILALTESEPEISSDTSRGLAALATQDQVFRQLRRRYHARQSTLHGDCFYLGICEPVDDVEGRIHWTADYINHTERLAGYSNGT